MRLGEEKADRAGRHKGHKGKAASHSARASRDHDQPGCKTRERPELRLTGQGEIKADAGGQPDRQPQEPSPGIELAGEQRPDLVAPPLQPSAGAKEPSRLGHSPRPPRDVAAIDGDAMVVAGILVFQAICHCT